MSKQSYQQVPDPVDANDVATKTFVERLGGRGAPDFIQAKLSSDQSRTWAVDDVVEFDTVMQNRGIEVDGVTNVGRFSTLKAGRTYFLTAGISLGDNGTRIPFSWHDVTNDVVLGSAGVPFSANVNSDSGYSVAPFALVVPSTDIEVEIRCLAVALGGGATTLSSAAWAGVGTSASIMEMGGPGGLAGPLEHLETIEVGADTTTVTFDGLNGDEDEEYYLEYFFPDPVGTVSYTLRPNGITANQTGARIFGGTSLDDATLSSLLIAAPISGDENSGRCWLSAKTGQNRFFHGQDAQISASADYVILTSGRWADTATNITSLDITASVASAIKEGARFSLYRLKRTNSSNIVSRTVLTADATTLSLTGLDGDTDGEYEISGTLITSLSAQDVDIAPNGSTTNMNTERVVSGGSAVDDSNGQFNSSGSATGHNVLRVKMRFWAARTINGVAVRRGFRATNAHQFGASSWINNIDVSGNWEDAAANLTSLDFICTLASGILEGSEVTVRRVG